MSSSSNASDLGEQLLERLTLHVCWKEPEKVCSCIGKVRASNIEFGPKSLFSTAPTLCTKILCLGHALSFFFRDTES